MLRKFNETTFSCYFDNWNNLDLCFTGFCKKDVSRNQVFYGHKNDYSMQKMITRVTSASISPEIMISVGIEVDEFAQIRLI